MFVINLHVIAKTIQTLFSEAVKKCVDYETMNCVFC